MKIFLFVFTLFYSVFTFAQYANNIPNADFEGDYQNHAPVGWTVLAANGYYAKAEIISDCQHGKAAIKLSSFNLPVSVAKQIGVNVIPGIISLGELNIGELINTYIDYTSITDPRVLAPFFKNGIPALGIPAKIEGYYKYKSSTPASIFAFTKRNGEVVNYARLSTELSESDEYQKFELIFNTNLGVDVSEIFFGGMTGEKEGDVLFLDNLSITYYKDLALKSIIPNGAELRPTFSSSCYNYKISVPYNTERMTFNAEAKDNSSVDVTISGPDSLILGSNIFTITTAYKQGKGADTGMVYQVNVNRKPKDYVLSNCANLKNLQIADMNFSPIFNKDTLVYRVSMGKETNMGIVNAALEDENAVLIENVDSLLLSRGKNPIFLSVITELTVIAEDDTTKKTYKIIASKSVESSLSLIEKTTREVLVYPNPVINGLITIEYKGKPMYCSLLENKSIRFFDSMGKQVGTFFATGEKTTVNISHLPKGIYLMTIGNEIVKVVKN